jgi:predicted transcriptional regulator
MCDDKKLLEKIAFVLASEHRKNIILYLGDELHTPKQIGDAINVRTNHISNLLAQLKKNDLVYCATPQMRKGKLYTLTDDGKYVLDYLKSQKV